MNSEECFVNLEQPRTSSSYHDRLKLCESLVLSPPRAYQAESQNNIQTMEDYLNLYYDGVIDEKMSVDHPDSDKEESGDNKQMTMESPDLYENEVGNDEQLKLPLYDINQESIHSEGTIYSAESIHSGIQESIQNEEQLRECQQEGVKKHEQAVFPDLNNHEAEVENCEESSPPDLSFYRRRAYRVIRPGELILPPPYASNTPKERKKDDRFYVHEDEVHKYGHYILYRQTDAEMRAANIDATPKRTAHDVNMEIDTELRNNNAKRRIVNPFDSPSVV